MMTVEDYDPFDLKRRQDDEDRLKLKKKLLSKADNEAFVWLMNDRRGRRFVWMLLESTGVFRSSFTGNSTTFFNEGQRNVGLMVLSLINELAPNQYIIAMNERKLDFESTK